MRYVSLEDLPCTRVLYKCLSLINRTICICNADRPMFTQCLLHRALLRSFYGNRFLTYHAHDGEPAATTSFHQPDTYKCTEAVDGVRHTNQPDSQFHRKSGQFQYRGAVIAER